MADETIAGNVGESGATDAKTTPPAAKKTRGPRRPKAAAEAVTTAAAAHAAAEKPAKKPRAKRGSKVVVAKDTKVAVKAPRAKPIDAKIVTAVDTLDDIADLIKLEEENKRLRKALSDKLRAENADLRKRLGHT